MAGRGVRRDEGSEEAFLGSVARNVNEATQRGDSDSGNGASREKGEQLHCTGGSSPIPTCGVPLLDAQ